MNLLLDTLRGGGGERRPLWIMRQAGRYLPEYRELRQRYDFYSLCQHPELAAEVTLQPLRRFDLDAAIVFADLMSPVAALGVDFRFDPGPVLDRPLRTSSDVAALPDPEEDEIAPEVLHTLTAVRRELPAECALLGFAGAPWSLAAYLVQGRGKKGFPMLRAMAAADPELLNELLQRLSRLIVRYCLGQHRAGADAVQLFDSWAGLLSLEQWQRLVKPHLEWVLSRLGEAGIPRILFAQDAPHLAAAMSRLPIEALSVDWRVDLGQLREAVGDRLVLQGNLDPAVLLAGEEVTTSAARHLLRTVPAPGHIVNLGHGILPDTPLASVEALVAAVHDEKVEHHDPELQLKA